MKIIQLGNNRVAKVDDLDFERLNRYIWSAQKPRKSSAVWYAVRGASHGKRVTTIYMHRVILGLTARNQITDHLDGDGLNNRRENLRQTTTLGNCQGHQNKRRGTSSKFRGVWFHRKNKNWCAQIMSNYQTTSLGSFDHQEDAARAYDVAASKAFGKFAQLNFPNEQNSNN